MNRTPLYRCAHIGLSALVLSTSGCASIVSNKRYNVPITANSDAEVEIRNHGRLVMNVRTPTTIALEPDGGFFVPADYTFTFKRENYPDTVMRRSANLDPWYLGNLLFGGLIGLLIVDPATGAMWKMDESPISDLSTEKCDERSEANTVATRGSEEPDTKIQAQAGNSEGLSELKRDVARIRALHEQGLLTSSEADRLIERLTWKHLGLQ